METHGAAKRHDLAMKAREQLPDDPDLARTLGSLCYRRKNYVYAVELFRQSAAVKQLDSRSLFYLGMSYLATNAQAQSRDALTKSLSAGLTDPLAAEARQTLAQLGTNANR